MGSDHGRRNVNGIRLVALHLRAVGRMSTGRCVLGRREPGEKSELSEVMGGCVRPWEVPEDRPTPVLLTEPRWLWSSFPIPDASGNS